MQQSLVSCHLVDQHFKVSCSAAAIATPLGSGKTYTLKYIKLCYTYHNSVPSFGLPVKSELLVLAQFNRKGTGLIPVCLYKDSHSKEFKADPLVGSPGLAYVTPVLKREVQVSRKWLVTCVSWKSGDKKRQKYGSFANLITPHPDFPCISISSLVDFPPTLFCCPLSGIEGCRELQSVNRIQQFTVAAAKSASWAPAVWKLMELNSWVFNLKATETSKRNKHHRMLYSLP